MQRGQDLQQGKTATDVPPLLRRKIKSAIAAKTTRAAVVARPIDIVVAALLCLGFTPVCSIPSGGAIRGPSDTIFVLAHPNYILGQAPQTCSTLYFSSRIPLSF